MAGSFSELLAANSITGAFGGLLELLQRNHRIVAAK
jgi:hypothetical protein